MQKFFSRKKLAPCGHGFAAGIKSAAVLRGPIDPHSAADALTNYARGGICNEQFRNAGRPRRIRNCGTGTEGQGFGGTKTTSREAMKRTLLRSILIGAWALASGTAIAQQQPPTITSASSTTFSAGVPGVFTVDTTGIPTPSITEGEARRAASHSSTMETGPLRSEGRRLKPVLSRSRLSPPTELAPTPRRHSRSRSTNTQPPRRSRMQRRPLPRMANRLPSPRPSALRGARRPVRSISILLASFWATE